MAPMRRLAAVVRIARGEHSVLSVPNMLLCAWSKCVALAATPGEGFVPWGGGEGGNTALLGGSEGNNVLDKFLLLLVPSVSQGHNQTHSTPCSKGYVS